MSFAALRKLTAEWTNYSVAVTGSLRWVPRTRILHFPRLEPRSLYARPGELQRVEEELLLHELCHWIAATPAERADYNLSLDWSRWSWRREAVALCLEIDVAHAADFDLYQHTALGPDLAYDLLGLISAKDLGLPEEYDPGQWDDNTKRDRLLSRWTSKALARFPDPRAFRRMVRALRT